MAADAPEEPTRSGGDRNGRVDKGWSELAEPSGALIVDMRFDSGGLAKVRVQLQECVRQAGLPEDRVVDMVLAVHELAANAVRHGGGAGRLRVWNQARTLHCQVDDRGWPGSAEQEADHGEIAIAEPKNIPDHAVANSLPCEPGHGLWVVQQVADRMQSQSGSRGTSVMIAFDY